MMKILLVLISILSLSANAVAESLSDVNAPAVRPSPRKAWGRDPFIRYGQKDERPSETGPAEQFRISGIISDGTRSVVIINGNFYRAGSVIGDYRILDISNERVLFEKNGKKYFYGIEKFALEGGKK